MWNPVDLDTVRNPHPFWAWLRREAPVYEVPGAVAEDEPGYFLVSRYEDVIRAAQNHETFSSSLMALLKRGEDGQPRLERTPLVGQPQSRVLGVADGEMHALHRRVVGRTFSPSRMERMSALAREITERCIDGVAGAKEFDVVETLAMPLPVEFTTRLLGLPLEDRPKLQAWTEHAFQLLNGLATEEELAKSFSAIDGFQSYLAERFDEALESPGEEVIGDLARAVHARERGEEGLERWEGIAVLYQLVVGGIETTVGLIGTTVLHAAQQPELWARLRKDADCISGFVEESLRLDGSSFGSYRRTTRDVELGGVELPEGSTVTLLWASANRDETQFPDPEHFILDRPNVKTHLGFGHGKHLCLGRALARMEVRVALQTLLGRYERISIADGPDTRRRRLSLTNRRLERLRVAVS
ncbi:MAG: cytochrome P450 [Deltaproteobacteria bacterium]|nr:cytochrome P450 [Deltaproteobacteria bacterium]